ncbi:MAG: L-ribulose-5-phosphate 3-epimerase [Spirochaetaceae bacterium]|jgi:predicted hexulose-6-phosphate isomerase|nr:L-ribulose-5-phosphate 3-epimerase [Spirochaetaceae bacterium]
MKSGGGSGYQLGLYEKSMPGVLTPEKKLREAGEAGFDYLELSIDETDEKLSRLRWGNAEIIPLRRSMEETGIPIRSICLSAHRRFPLGDPDPGVQRKSLAIMEGAIVLASRLGVRIIQIAGYDVYYKQSDSVTREIFADNLERCLAMAAREGVMLAFETMETPFIDTVEKAMFWVERFPSPYLQVYPDIGNITNAAALYGTDVLADLKRGAGHLAALHLKETKPGIYREVPYGEGHVDFAAAVKTGLSLGVGLYMGEFWYTGGENWREVLGENNRFLRKALDAGLSL